MINTPNLVKFLSPKSMKVTAALPVNIELKLK